MSWQEAVTGYVKQKITEVDWADREYIDKLVTIESYLLRGGAHSFAEGMHWNDLRRTYRVDARSIRQELDHLRASDPDKFQELLTRKKQIRADRDAQEDAAERAANARNESARRRWVSAGGRP